MSHTALSLLKSLVGLVFWAGSSFSYSNTAIAVSVRHDRQDAETLRAGGPFDGVGRLLSDGGCTLIAPTWVLTAAHTAASIPVGGQLQIGEKKYTVKKTVIHPEGIGAKGVPPEVDLALVELAEPVAGIRPIELYRRHDELGKTVFIVGYGDYGNPVTGFKKSDGQRRAVTNIVDDAGPRRMFMKFDLPPKGTELEGVGGPGDSGGPALIQQNGKVYVAGVSSASMNGRPGQYGVTDVYTRVSSFIEWIEKTTRSGHERH